MTLTQRGLPRAWTSQDVGDVGEDGSADFMAGEYTIEGAGEDIRGREDSFHFVYQTFSGDGEITARVIDQTETNSRAKSGVMIRESLDADAPHAFMAMTPSSSSYFVFRTEAGESSDEDRGSESLPHWVRLVREGNVLTGFSSEDGDDWDEVGSATVSLSDDVLVGLAVTSRRSGELSTAMFTNVAIMTDNAAPVANDDVFSQREATTVSADATAGVLHNDVDEDGDPLTVSLVEGPADGTLTLNTDGSFAFDPNGDFTGLDTFTYRVNDGMADSNVATVTIVVNDVPVGTNDAYQVDEDQSLEVDANNGVLANDTDPDGNPLTAQLQQQATFGTVTLNADGSFRYTPNANFTGTDSFVYRAADAFEQSSDVTVMITVDPVNDAPTVPDAAYDLAPGATLTVDAAAGLLANATDVENDSMTASVFDEPSHGTLAMNADGSFTFEPNADFPGTDSFTFRANDGEADSNVATVTITQLGLPRPWMNQDIGEVEAEGTVDFASGEYTVAGSGDDIRGRADSFQFVYQTVTGDVELVAGNHQSNRNQLASQSGRDDPQLVGRSRAAHVHVDHAVRTLVLHPPHRSRREQPRRTWGKRSSLLGPHRPRRRDVYGIRLAGRRLVGRSRLDRDRNG